jgi:aldehyde dehydrogenase (NAD+)
MSLNIPEILNHLHINDNNEAFSTGSQWGSSAGAQVKKIVSPVDGKEIASVNLATESDYNKVIGKAAEAFQTWRTVPAPKRGEIVRQIGEALREHKQELGALVSYEMGKSLQEGFGEVQEMIDICDFAVGLWVDYAF